MLNASRAASPCGGRLLIHEHTNMTADRGVGGKKDDHLPLDG